MKRISGIKAFAYLVFAALSAACVIPFILLISASLTDNQSIILWGYQFWPKQWSYMAYRYLWVRRDVILRSYMLSILTTGIGTSVGLLISMMLAYVLSRPDFRGRRVMLFYVFFTMLFSGGMVPSYLLYGKYLQLKNTVAGLIIPHLMVSAFNVNVMRTYFSSTIPMSVIESAKIDGASEFTVLIKIVVPMSTSILATIGLLIGISYWNDWYNGTMYATKSEYYGIQTLLSKMLKDIQWLQANGSESGSEAIVILSQMPTHSVRMAIATIVVVPVLLMFPFFQKYFARGIAFGAIKG